MNIVSAHTFPAEVRFMARELYTMPQFIWLPLSRPRVRRSVSERNESLGARNADPCEWGIKSSKQAFKAEQRP